MLKFTGLNLVPVILFLLVKYVHSNACHTHTQTNKRSLQKSFQDSQFTSVVCGGAAAGFTGAADVPASCL